MDKVTPYKFLVELPLPANITLIYDYVEAMLAAYVEKFGGLPAEGLAYIEESDGGRRHRIIHPPSAFKPVPVGLEGNVAKNAQRWRDLAGDLAPENAEIVFSVPQGLTPGAVRIVALAEAFK
jgi:hypothetical protein